MKVKMPRTPTTAKLILLHILRVSCQEVLAKLVPHKPVICRLDTPGMTALCLLLQGAIDVGLTVGKCPLEIAPYLQNLLITLQVPLCITSGHTQKPLDHSLLTARIGRNRWGLVCDQTGWQILRMVSDVHACKLATDKFSTLLL